MSAAEDELAAVMRWANLPEPVREHRFAAPARQWRFDFAWPDQMVACEVEGGSWVGGAHTRGKHFEADCEKYADGLIRGWRILRVTPRMVRDGRAVNYLSALLGGAAP